MTELDRSIAAWRQAFESVLALGDTLSAGDWQATTECPGWRVKDVYAHLVGGEAWMAAGNPRPEQGLARISDEPVAAHRDTPGADVLSQLRSVYRHRLEQVAASPPDPAQPAFTAWGQPVPLGTLWRFRAFDAWVHEQDIRRALARPGNLDSPGALIAYEVLRDSLPRVVAKSAAAPPGSVVRFDVDGAVSFDLCVAVGDDGRGRLSSAAAAGVTSTLRLDWEHFARRGCGRIAPEDAGATIAGDTALGQRVLAQMAVTP